MTIKGPLYCPLEFAGICWDLLGFVPSLGFAKIGSISGLLGWFPPGIPQFGYAHYWYVPGTLMHGLQDYVR
jgi:hypothetical protein